MVRVLVIHGRADAFGIGGEMETRWADAIRQGLAAARYPAPDAVSVELAFFGDVWRPDADEDIAVLTRFERSQINAQTRGPAGSQTIRHLWPDQPAVDLPPHHAIGLPDWRSVLREGAALVDPLLPDAVLRAAVRVRFPDVFDYLEQDELAAQVLDKVAAAMPADGEPVVLVGHSFGSLIGYEYLHGAPYPEIAAFISVGSQFGFPFVRDVMGAALRRRGGAADASLSFPPALPLWYNVYSPDDLSAGDGDLAEHIRASDHRKVLDRESEGKDGGHDGVIYASSVTFGVCLRAVLEDIEERDGSGDAAEAAQA